MLHALAAARADSPAVLGRIALFIVAMLIALLFASVAHAQDAAIPVGAAMSGLVDFAAPVVFAAVAWLFRKVPKNLAAVLIALRVDQLLNVAVNYGINATKDAVAGKTLSLPVGNEVARLALEYALAHAPQLSASFGVGRLREKILARLTLDENAAVPAPAPRMNVG